MRVIRTFLFRFVLFCFGVVSTACDEGTSSFSDAIDVCAGANHGCALRENGKIVCWGDNSDGQSSVPPNELFIEVDCSENVTCGIRTDGSLGCWGDESICPLEEGSPDCWNTAVAQPPAGTGYHGLVVPFDSACVLDTDGSPICWGGRDVDAPAETPTEEKFFQLSGDGYAYCGLRAEGTVLCWGQTYFLDGEPDVIDQPNDIKPIPEGMRFSQISIQYHYGCGVLETDPFETWCWGEDTRDYLDPTGFDLPEQTSPVIRIDSNAGYKCILRQGETPACYGEQLALDYPPNDQFVQLAYGGDFGCGILSNGKVKCWGDDYKGAASPP